MADNPFRKNAGVVRELVSEAQSLEENKRFLEAYVKYLKCVEFISQALLQNTESSEAEVVEDIKFKQRLLSLAKNCIERSEETLTALLNSTASQAHSGSGTHAGVHNYGNQSHDNQPHGNQNHVPTPQHHLPIQHSESVIDSSTRPAVLPTNYRLTSTYPAALPHISTTPSPKPRSDPGQHILVDRAQHMNRKLMSIYQERMKRQMKGSNLPQCKEMSLGALRRLEESVSIAKAKEKDLQMKAKRLQHLKKFDQMSGVSKARTDPEKLSSAVTSYERLKARYFKLRAKLMKTPVSPLTVKALVNEALKDQDHPMYKEFGKLQFFIFEKLKIIIKELNDTRFLPWIQEVEERGGVRGSSGGEGSWNTSDEQMFAVSMSSGSLKRPSQVTRSLSPRPSRPEYNTEGEHHLEKQENDAPFDDKLKSLRAVLLKDDTSAEEPASSRQEEEEDEDELMNELEKEISSDPPMVVMPRTPSPVTTGDISPSDLQEVFGSERDALPIETGGPPPLCKLHISRDTEHMQVLQQKAAKELPQIVREIQSALSTLIQCVLNTYNVQDEQGEIRDALEPVVEGALFPPLWPHLLTVFRLKNYAEEIALATNMARYFKCIPADLQVREKFWLCKEPDTPYGKVLEEIEKLVKLSCPTDKLSALVNSSKLIFQTIDDYYSKYEGGNGPKQSGIGVDDILPIVCYVVARTGKPQVLSELNALEEFIHESFILGEDGFCLTTFHTAVEYLKTSDQL